MGVNVQGWDYYLMKVERIMSLCFHVDRKFTFFLEGRSCDNSSKCRSRSY